MKIAVIEDEKPIREGLVHILNKISPEYQVVGLSLIHISEPTRH